MARKMHADEVESDDALLRRLLQSQFPQWAGLPIERIEHWGTDNAIYRLGGDLVARLPRNPRAIHQVEKEHRWLPTLAPKLPLVVPNPIAVGEPGEGYPWQWSVQTWLTGENATRDRLADLSQAAIDLADFIRELQSIDPTGGPVAGSHNFYRGVPLSVRDVFTRAAIARSEGMIDTEAVTAAWEAALRAPPWDGAPVWLHGDLSAGNLLAVDGRLSGVIDFGCLGVGDPACELIVAWSLFTGAARQVFRAALGVDDATWERGRGWALQAVAALPYYRETNPVIVRGARHTITEVLADHAANR